MDEIELTLIAISASESQKGNFVIVFEESGSFRRLPIIVGNFEAQAIAIALEKMSPNRPLTHDLFHDTVMRLGAKLKKVRIHKFENDMFFAQLILDLNGEEIKIDARTSDAVALAVRSGSQIFTTEEVMAKTSIVLDDPSDSFTNKRGRLEDYSLDELEMILQKLLQKEDYRSAVRVRNAIKKKKGL